MALQTETPQATPSPQMVANAFVEQYYHILHHSPELVYRFYQESSVLSRPDSKGGMISVTTMEGINEKILSLDYKNYKAEIKTADAQKSHQKGVTVLVTGCLIGKDHLRRKFAQSFFLAPQDNGYFVLNDVFRYLDDDQPLNTVDKANQVSPNPEPDAPPVPEPPAPDKTIPIEEKSVSEKEKDVVNRDILIADQKETVVELQPQSSGNDTSTVAESTSSAQEDSAKKSYASIVKVAKGSPGPSKVYVPTYTLKVTPKKTESEPVRSNAPAPAPEAVAQNTVDGPEMGNSHGEAEGYSIYIRNLPFNTSPSQLEAEFKKFGPIKEDSIQVRNNKQQGYCFAFIEFLSASSMNDAIQASPMTILGREAVIEVKRTTARADGERSRFSSGRGGYRNESFRARGHYAGGRSFGRSDHGNWSGEPSGRGRGSSRGGQSYQQVRGRGGGRSSGPKPDSG